MTKVRDPLTTEEAFDLVVGVLTIDGAARVMEREAPYLRAISDPDKPMRLSVDDAIRLDLAYIAAGNTGTPIYDSIGLRIRTADALDLAGAAVLVGHAVDLTREHGEALAALLEAATAAPDSATLREALRQLVDGHRAYEAAIRTVRCKLERGTCGPEPPPDTS